MKAKLITLTAAIALSGCNANNDLLGEWTAEKRGQKLNFTFTDTEIQISDGRSTDVKRAMYYKNLESDAQEYVILIDGDDDALRLRYSQEGTLQAFDGGETKVKFELTKVES